MAFCLPPLPPATRGTDRPQPAVDPDVLREQVAERARIAAFHRDRELEEDDRRVRLDAHCCHLEQEVQALRRERTKGVVAFRRGHQTKDTTREWDLNDPTANRRARPIRVGDADPHLGPSSVQIFGGEELTYKERLRSLY